MEFPPRLPKTTATTSTTVSQYPTDIDGIPAESAPAGSAPAKAAILCAQNRHCGEGKHQNRKRNAEPKLFHIFNLAFHV